MKHPIDKIVHQLRDCILSLEYVNDHFPMTGGSATRACIIEESLRALAEYEILKSVDAGEVRVVFDPKRANVSTNV